MGWKKWKKNMELIHIVKEFWIRKVESSISSRNLAPAPVIEELKLIEQVSNHLILVNEENDRNLYWRTDKNIIQLYAQLILYSSGKSVSK